ncbi:MAG: class I SAM-dependent methyltransferase [Gammaproteobacteria bacterium]|nr:class I SAM-dependent methyltransferase [Gammaproteobacteria bacterium]
MAAPAEAYQGYQNHLRRIGQEKLAARGGPGLDFRAPCWLPQDPEASILELGCGEGRRLEALHAMGYRSLSGVDLLPELVRAARERVPPEVPVACADATEFLRTTARRYDRVLLFHVLEHFPASDGIELLRAIRSRLQPAGRVVVEVPNLSSVTGPHMFYSDITHRSAYTEYSLTQAFEQAGYSRIELLCPAPRVDFRSWRPWRPLRGTTLVWRSNRMFHRVLHFVAGSWPRAHCVCQSLLMAAGA